MSIFGKRDKHTCSASAVINLSMVSIVDSLLSTLHASANRIVALRGQRIFHWLWLCGQSLFFLSGCRPRFSRLAASPLDALSRAWLTEEKKETARSLLFSTAKIAIFQSWWFVLVHGISSGGMFHNIHVVATVSLTEITSTSFILLKPEQYPLFYKRR